MTSDAPKRLRLFAGPNGSGKTSLVRKLAKEFAADGLFQLHHFLNADDLFRQLQEGSGIRLDFLGRTLATDRRHSYVSSNSCTENRQMNVFSPRRTRSVSVCWPCSDTSHVKWREGSSTIQDRCLLLPRPVSDRGAAME